MLATVGLVGCSANKADGPPPTIVPAQAAQSPPVTGAPAGVVRPLPGQAQAAVFDPATTRKQSTPGPNAAKGHMHPAVRAGLIETAKRLDPLVLRWGK